MFIVDRQPVPDSFIVNVRCISPGEYTFNINDAKNVPVKGIGDKRQIAVTFAVSGDGDILPMCFSYTGNTKTYLPNFDFPHGFSLKFTKNHWCNMEKTVEHFEKVIFLFSQKTKDKHRYSKEQMSLVIMDIFKGQDNKVFKEL